MENNNDTIFCTNCGKKITRDGNFCPHCGNPLDSFSDAEFSEENEGLNTKKPRKFNKNYGKTSKKNKNSSKIIIPVVVISILVFGAIFFTLISNNSVSNNSSLKIFNVTEKINHHELYSLPTLSGEVSATVIIECSPYKTIENIRTISIDNMVITYNDSSTLDNQFVEDLGVTKYIGGEYYNYDTILEKGGDYELSFTTKHTPNKEITHIEGDIIAHTTIDGDFKLRHFDEDVTAKRPNFFSH